MILIFFILCVLLLIVHFFAGVTTLYASRFCLSVSFYTLFHRRQKAHINKVKSNESASLFVYMGKIYASYCIADRFPWHLVQYCILQR